MAQWLKTFRARVKLSLIPRATYMHPDNAGPISFCYPQQREKHFLFIFIQCSFINGGTLKDLMI